MHSFWRLTGRMVGAVVLYSVAFFAGGQHLYGAGLGLVAAMVWLEWAN